MHTIGHKSPGTASPCGARDEVGERATPAAGMARSLHQPTDNGWAAFCADPTKGKWSAAAADVVEQANALQAVLTEAFKRFEILAAHRHVSRRQYFTAAEETSCGTCYGTAA